MDAGGQKQFIDCEGSGGPTLVLVSGVWGSSTDWAAQVGIWRTRGRVCTYDRPGLGRSPARRGDQSVDSGMHARELHALLRAAGERGPIILVGHSYGGLIARSYLDLYPSEVAGLALLEAVPAGFQDIYPDYGLTLQDTSTSTVDLDRSSVATGGTAPLNGLPLVVLSADHPESSRPASVAALWTAQQDLLARASRNSLRLIAINSYHQLQVYAPRAVVAAVEALRTSVRTHRLLPGCGPQWAAVGATCFPRTGG
jgi:pimeloyl-ACP methyl ester carboxylesterase